MGSRRLAEATVTLMQTYIKANIAAALATVRTDRADAKVTTEPPASYFIYRKPQGYKLPAVFVICEDFDFKIQENKSNFVNAKPKVNVSILVEDKDAEALTYKAWRYQSAMHLVLDEAHILSTDGKVKLAVSVTRAPLGPIYMRTEKGGDGSEFRQEIYFECEVEHYENF